MAKLSMQLKAKDQTGKSVSTTFTNVNPEAPDNDKLQVAMAMNSLTANTYSSTDLIKTINLDTETDAGKQTPTFSLAKTTFTQAEVNALVSQNITTNSDGQFWIGKVNATNDNPNAGYGSILFGITQSETPNIKISPNVKNGYEQTAFIGTFAVGVFETDTYQSAEVTVTITA